MTAKITRISKASRACPHIKIPGKEKIKTKVGEIAQMYRQESTNAIENVFADFIYRYTIQKKKIDFEMQLNNVFGTNNFKTINVSDFSYVATNFLLRPRQLLFKVRFSL